MTRVELCEERMGATDLPFLGSPRLAFQRPQFEMHRSRRIHPPLAEAMEARWINERGCTLPCFSVTLFIYRGFEAAPCSGENVSSAASGSQASPWLLGREGPTSSCSDTKKVTRQWGSDNISRYVTGLLKRIGVGLCNFLQIFSPPPLPPPSPDAEPVIP